MSPNISGVSLNNIQTSVFNRLKGKNKKTKEQLQFHNSQLIGLNPMTVSSVAPEQETPKQREAGPLPAACSDSDSQPRMTGRSTVGHSATLESGPVLLSCVLVKQQKHT